ncbi:MULTISPECIES: HpaII family restriction endonuclease [unclassified Kaistella]|uniref:HpaII family restriction endonuclease n=1 Tax=unclassified Kaistella TaxID=2762626 RepID=UPI002737006C|nr:MULTISPECIES: HpaII family restriction endonuclease [unclassified Kaistella]MDP2453478.1 HpaII family restriction endonuclease [Kaistella sp. SH11-4b]MDP2456535.1 HpaII family restriction endonuclease [Kaistella sp. SH40-3]MDP2459291.1 HpaII family restriction endonuclease [Kaistella sp. SH19-2b]
MLTGNKGEWSEIYALFKLLGDKELHPGNKDIKKINNLVYPILKIIRNEVSSNFEYSIQDDIVIISGNKEMFRIPIVEFQQRAKYLLDEIKSNSGTFSVPEIEDFMKSINCISLKAKSTSKTDITIVVHDQRTGLQPALGFSIKSQLGHPSTLLNAGETTNFIFKIIGRKFNKQEIVDINNISSKSKIKDRIVEIENKGGKLQFAKTQRSIFGNNLILIDSLLPEILANIVLDFYSTPYSHTSDLVQLTENKNPLNFDITDKHLFYGYKIKRFLTDVALGMMPSKVWTGDYEATGGYLIVKEDGDILCYHIYNKNEFENYLLSNTKLETASSSRHNFGEVYEEDGELFFKLNLQIRFL